MAGAACGRLAATNFNPANALIYFSIKLNTSNNCSFSKAQAQPKNTCLGFGFC
jgi:hypothetical protein